MAEPTTTRQTLRREIAQEVGMPFFRRFPSGFTIQDTATSGLASISDSSGIRDSRLTQKRDYWINTWVMLQDTAGSIQSRLTVDFQQQSNTLVPEYDWTGTPDSSYTVEIYNIHNPDEIHLAVNNAIAEGFPAFFDVQTSEEIVLEEDKLEYELVTDNSDGRGVLTNPFRIKSVEIERTGSGSTHRLTAADTSASTTTVSGTSFTATDTGWMVSVFSGAGSGQLSSITSGDSSGVITWDTPPTVAPDTSSSIRIWDAASEIFPWQPFTAIQFDAKDYPNKMRFLENLRPESGLRMRVQYVAEPQALTADSSTTAIPKRYIKHYVMSDLFRQRARTKPGDRQAYLGLAQEESQMAEKYKLDHGYDLPDQTLWTEQEWGSARADYFERNNPLDW